MKKHVRFALLLAIFVIPLLAKADCYMYAYADQWVDGNGNLVVVNSTDPDMCGFHYSAYADVMIHMPSGYEQSDSAYEHYGTFAEAMAMAPITEEELGDGFIEGSNTADFNCGEALVAAFSFPIKPNLGIEFVWYDDPVHLPTLTKCGYTKVDNCSRADGIYCGDANPTVIEPCGDGAGFYLAWLTMYGYAEVKIGPLLIGGCLSPKTGAGSHLPAGRCTAEPPHLQ